MMRKILLLILTSTFLGLLGGSSYFYLRDRFGFVNPFEAIEGLAIATIFSVVDVPGTEGININLKYKRLERLGTLRKEALAYVEKFGGAVPSYVKEYVKGTAVLTGPSSKYFEQPIPLKIRLKGVMKYHYEGKKWSMRVKVRRGKSLWGMRSFSLSDPQRRAMFLYWLLNKAFQMEGGIGLNTDLVKVKINGESLGMYSIEEIPSKFLIERNKRREGVILRFDQEHLKEGFDLFSGTDQDEAFIRARVEVVNSKVENVSAQIARAVGLLTGFQRGDLSAKEVFNLNILARWIALNDVFYGWHGFSWPNMRFYYDPILGKIEPIIWDAYDENKVAPRRGRVLRIDDSYNDPTSAFLSKIFQDEGFVEKYMGQLYKMSEPSYLDEILKYYSEEMKYYIWRLKSDYPLYSTDKDIKMLYDNQEYIRSTYLKKDKRLSLESSRECRFEVQNLGPLPIILRQAGDRAEIKVFLSSRRFGKNVFCADESKAQDGLLKLSYTIVGKSEKVYSENLKIKRN